MIEEIVLLTISVILIIIAIISADCFTARKESFSCAHAILILILTVELSLAAVHLSYAELGRKGSSAYIVTDIAVAVSAVVIIFSVVVAVAA